MFLADATKFICKIFRLTSNLKHAKRYCNISEENTFSHCALVTNIVSTLNEE